MNAKQPDAPSGGMDLGNIYFVLFRHKWKIILCSLAGILAAAVVYLGQSSPYQSEAKLFIRYVQENRAPSAMGNGSPITQTDSRGDGIISSEVEILTSLDLADQVADAVGVDKMLAKAGGGNNHNQAAALISRNLKVEVPKYTSVLLITFQHPDPAIVQPVLNQLIAFYQTKHLAVHRSPGLYDDALTKKVDDLRAQLAQTEDQLKKQTKTFGVTSMEETKKGYAELISKIRQALLGADAELAERQAAVKVMEKLLPTKSTAVATDLGAPLEKINEYKRVFARLDVYRQRERELLLQFPEENRLVKSIREQIATAEALQKKLEDENPKLAGLNVPSQNLAGQPVDWSIARSLADETIQIMKLQTRTNTLSLQLEEITANASSVNELEGPITQLQRKRDLEEKELFYFTSTLETARWDESLNAGKASNISVVESPSPPFQASSKFNKAVVMLAVGGMVGGIALAFLIEMFLDQTLKRPLEVEARLRLPLILSIPHTRRNKQFQLAQTGGNGHLRLKGPESETAIEKTGVAQTNGNAEVAPWEDTHQLRPFYEALRDRLMTNFENRQLTHKPKLVAVTGCSPGSGVTSLAAGLAATLSETGDGNVLLVDMNLQHGAVHPFFKGKPACGLAEVLEHSKNELALVRENLYMATGETNSDKLPRILPKRFSNLVPKLKASEYDYIIFDMPPVSQTSVTPRLAGFMDMVLLVVESEKTDREIARRASMLLEESKAHVNIVLNKTRTYVPAQLHQEFQDGV